jgi:putative membrane protein
MANLRTGLALDRTSLAWVRTTLTMASFGFGMVAFFRSLRQANPTPEMVRLHQGAIFFGTALIVLGTLATLLAALSQWRSLRKLRRGETPRISPWPLSLTVSLMVSVLFMIGFWSLLSR